MSIPISVGRTLSDLLDLCSFRNKVRVLLLACLFVATTSLAGCQGLTRRGKDDFALISDNDDDWSYPSHARSQVPRPVVATANRNQRRIQDPKSSAGTLAVASPLGSSAKLSESSKYGQGPVAYGIKETKDQANSLRPESASSADPVSTVASTNTQDIDIEGALGSLPAEYREVLKKQLEGVQAKLAAEGNSSQTSETLASSTTKSSNKSGVSIRLSDTASNETQSPASTAIAEATVPSSSPTTSNTTPTKPASAQSIAPTTTLATAPSNNAGVVTASGSASPSSASHSSVVTASASVPMPTLPPLPSTNSQPSPSSPATWKQEVSQAIELLEKQIKDTPTSDESMRLSQEVTLRLLYVSQRRLADACRPIEIESLSDSEQEYLRNQMIALHEASNPDAMPVRSRHWSLVMNSQREATNHLAAASNLEVKSLAFCTEVERYGVITKFPKNHFLADQEVLLYCEIENVAAEKVRNGFETQLQGSYEIIDSQGRKVADQLLPMEPELCQNHRRDYFIVYKIYMPQQIASGSYQLRLTIEDLKARKFGQGQVDFQIKR